MCSEVIIRKAQFFDLDQIKKLSDYERDTIGFMTRATYEKAIIDNCIFVACISERVIGFQYYYHRKRDSQTTLYQKTVDEEYRNLGIARLLVQAVIEEARSIGHTKICLKCPEDLPSNEFHKKIGFKFVRQDIGKKRKLNVYELEI